MTFWASLKSHLYDEAFEQVQILFLGGEKENTVSLFWFIG